MPSSAAKLASARTNGAKSRGPITERGRKAVALNAVKHGLTAQTIILCNESPEEYQAELQDYLDHFRPQGPPELHLVHQLAAAGWRLARYAGVESGLLNAKMDEQANCDIPDKQRVALAFEALASSSPSLSLANRYQSRLHHEYQRVLKTLLQLQATRAKLQNKPNPIVPPAVLEFWRPVVAQASACVNSQVSEHIPQEQPPQHARACYPEDSCAVSSRSSFACPSLPPRRPAFSISSATSCNEISPFSNRKPTRHLTTCRTL